MSSFTSAWWADCCVASCWLSWVLCVVRAGVSLLELGKLCGGLLRLSLELCERLLLLLVLLLELLDGVLETLAVGFRFFALLLFVADLTLQLLALCFPLLVAVPFSA